MTLAIADADYARDLTDRIKVAVEGTWQLVKEAYVSRAWSALGYQSWDDYCTREFGTSRLRLPREERQEVVGSLRDAGLSIRAIAAATGHGTQLIQKELRDAGVVIHHTSPDPAPAVDDDPFGPDLPTGEYSDLASIVDDAQYDDDPALTEEECRALADPDDLDDEPARVTGVDGKSYPAAKPRKPSRSPLPDAFWRATYDLGKKVNTLTNLAADDRFNSNADQIGNRNLPELIRARDALAGVIEQLQTQGA